jgi:hypothetical protein
VSTEIKTMLQLRSLNSSKQFWNARTSVGQTKLKAAGMKSKMSHDPSGLCVPGLMDGCMYVLSVTSVESGELVVQPVKVIVR